jgi:hypothetical protein
MPGTTSTIEKERINAVKIVSKLAMHGPEPIQAVIASSPIGRALLSEEAKKELLRNGSLRSKSFLRGAELQKAVRPIRSAPNVNGPRARHTVH